MLLSPDIKALAIFCFPLPGPRDIRPTDPGFPVRTSSPQHGPASISQGCPPHGHPSRSKLPGGLQGWCSEMDSGGSQEEFFRASRASAASSFRCHSKAAEREACSEALETCKGKGCESMGAGEPYLLPPGQAPLQPPVPWSPTPTPKAFCSSHPLSSAPPRVWSPLLSQDLWLQ